MKLGRKFSAATIGSLLILVVQTFGGQFGLDPDQTDTITAAISILFGSAIAGHAYVDAKVTSAKVAKGESVPQK